MIGGTCYFVRSQHRPPLGTLQQVEKLMHISPDDQSFSKIRPELQNGVPLVNLHELKRLQKLEGPFADGLGLLRKRVL